MRHIELKVKIDTLAAEARIIRRNERKSLNLARISSIRSRLAAAGYDNTQVDRIVFRAHKRLGRRVDDHETRSVGYEMTGPLRRAISTDRDNSASTIEARLAKSLSHYGSYERLRHHRVHVVRREARDSLLAYAIMRGRPYSSVESGAKSSPDWKNVQTIAVRFGVDAGTIQEWLAAAEGVIEKAA